MYLSLENTKNSQLTRRFRQLLRQIFSSDSILQLICPKAIEPLMQYGDGNGKDVTLGALVPALEFIFRNMDSTPPVPEDFETKLRELSALLARRAKNVFEDLVISREVRKETTLSPSADEDWRKTGCYYGRPPIRHRPFYEGRDVGKSLNVVAEGSCRKFYTTYGKKNLTGGLMALWCPHLVCLGFHQIPKAEGRNDVFSALFKYWEKAPKVVLYDFACQLGPYSMAREPEFFKDTLFAVDEMHANGHFNCSQAAWVSNYMQVRPRLQTINSSAAECSNSGLSRIRKSVSYMTQEHAIAFTYVYLCVWNRRREHLFRAEGDKNLLKYRRLNRPREIRSRDDSDSDE